LSALSYLEDLSSAEETVLLFREKSMGLERDIFVEMAVFMWKFRRGGFFVAGYLGGQGIFHPGVARR